MVLPQLEQMAFPTLDVDKLTKTILETVEPGTELDLTMVLLCKLEENHYPFQKIFEDECRGSYKVMASNIHSGLQNLVLNKRSMSRYYSEVNDFS